MTDQQKIEAFTVIGFGFILMAFVVGELIVTWRRELRGCRCQRRF